VANPFTAESRDARLSLGLAGFIDKLRAPGSIHALVMRAKPMTVAVSDFALKAMLDAHLTAAFVRSDYREVYTTLGTLFGLDVTAGTRKPLAKAPVTGVQPRADRHTAGEHA
jgi:hypothetical protein